MFPSSEDSLLPLVYLGKTSKSFWKMSMV